MLGWMISVRRVVDESAVRASLNVLPGDRVRVTVPDNAVGEVLAKWQAGVDGIRWIKQASEREGGVALEIECGYPHRYLARARDILGTIRTRTPFKAPMYEYPRWIIPEESIGMEPGPGYAGKTVIDEDAMRQCSSDEWLYIEVWDES